MNVLQDIWNFLRRAFYLTYEGGAQSGSIDVTADGIQLPYQPCRFVKLENLTITGESAFKYREAAGTDQKNLNLEVYYGFGGILAHALYDGQATELLPIDNLNRIQLWARPGQTVKIWYSWFY